MDRFKETEPSASSVWLLNLCPSTMTWTLVQRLAFEKLKSLLWGHLLINGKDTLQEMLLCKNQQL